MTAPALLLAGSACDTTTTRYAPMVGYGINSGSAFVTTEREVQSVAPCAGTIRDLRVQLFSDPGAGNSITVTLRVNGANTALTVTISDTTRYGEDLTHDVSVSAGDLLCYSVVPTSGPTDETQVRWSAIYEGSGNDIPILGSQSAAVNSDAFTGGYGHQGPQAWDTTQDNSEKFYFPVAGTITAFYIHANVTGNFGTDIVKLRKNTTDEASANITVPDATGDQTGNATGLSIAIAAGDTVTIFNDFTTSWTMTLKWGIAFTPTTAGQCPVIIGAVPSTSAASYPLPGWVGGATLSSERPWPMPACDIKNPYADVATAPGSGKTWDIDVRTGAAVGSMANGNSHLDIDGTATSDSDTTTDTYTDGMFFGVTVTPGGTPTAVGDAMRIALVAAFPSAGYGASILSGRALKSLAMGRVLG